MPATHPGLESSGLILNLSLKISQQMKRSDLKSGCWQILNDVIILNTKEAQCTQQMGHIAFIICSGYTVGEARVSWVINSGGMRTMCPCVSVFSSSLQIAATTHWLSFSNTRQESGMLFISVPPHQGDEWVLLILWVCDWRLLFP